MKSLKYVVKRAKACSLIYSEQFSQYLAIHLITTAILRQLVGKFKEQI